ACAATRPRHSRGRQLRAALEFRAGREPQWRPWQGAGSAANEVPMKLSTDRILTTHVGSLPRSAAVVEFLYKKENGEQHDRAAFAATMKTGVAEVVAKQRAVGIDIVSDGETSKVGYATYIKDRLSGFAGHVARPPHKDLAPYPEFREAMGRMMGKQSFK